MGNIQQDMSKLTVTIKHPEVGTFTLNEHLKNVISEAVSDTETITEPGAGGGRVHKIMKDTARKITVEVNTGSEEESKLRRCIRYKNSQFETLWSDERVEAYVMEGSGSECSIKDVANDRSSETTTFEIVSMVYSGD